MESGDSGRVVVWNSSRQRSEGDVMAIWEHKDGGAVCQWMELCRFCRRPLEIVDLTAEANASYDIVLHALDKKGGHFEVEVEVASFGTCRLCGWWLTHLRGEYPPHAGSSYSSDREVWSHSEVYGSCPGNLLRLDLTDLSLPVEEVRKYLCAKYESRFEMNPLLVREDSRECLSESGLRCGSSWWLR
jgi:hypothetical protein